MIRAGLAGLYSRFGSNELSVIAEVSNGLLRNQAVLVFLGLVVVPGDRWVIYPPCRPAGGRAARPPSTF